jgi:D-alanyl-lipoteichoic acid acyltransferase DltB (MBOAT superfamily)
MVFSDPIFIVGFLPIALLLFHLCRARANGDAAIACLIILSMIFYAYWSLPFLLVLLGQIAVNYLLGSRLQRTASRGILAIVVTFNLGLLGYFKYRNFFLENIEALAGTHFALAKIIVPLGISFHTFQQIALMVDIKDGEAELPPLPNYALFVLFFPQLIAGPVVLHREMGKQISAIRAGSGAGLAMFGAGATLFVIGLFKKVALADNIAVYADAAFAPGQPLMIPEAWIGAIDYALQLYFDFSGYSDMAVGLGLMFGITLPHNFLIPFAAPSMIDYWKRWHITMTRFFTMYVYTPLALSATRYAMMRRIPAAPQFLLAVAFPTIVTFLLSGLWHGAGWTFVCFGLVNGLALAINHAWNASVFPSLPRIVGWALTMVTVIVTLVYFRSGTLAQAHYLLHQMFAPTEPLSVPGWASTLVPALRLPTGTFTLLSELRDSVYCLAWTVLLGILALIVPPIAARPGRLNPSYALAFATAAMGWLILDFIDQPRTFLYFAF